MRWTVLVLAGAIGAAGCDDPEAEAGRADAPEVESAPESESEPTAAPEAEVDAAPDSADTPEEDPRDPNEPPENYGAMVPKVPPPDASELTVHALADFTIVTIYSQPNLESERLGYLRRGQRMMVTPKIDDTGEGCPKGFHALPTGGFACASKGLVVKEDDEPFMHRPPPPPRVEDAVPYDYAVISKQGAPMWWRVPDTEEVTLAQLRYDNTIGKEKAAEKAKKAAEKAKKNPQTDKKNPQTVADAEQPEDVLPSVDDEVERAPTPEEIEARKEAERKRLAELAIKWEKLPLHPQRPFMDRGNMISIGSRVKDKGRTWWRTARGGYVQTSHTYRYGPKDFQGAEIPDDSDFPFGFVWEEDHAASHRMLEDGKLKWNGKLQWRSFIDAVEEVEIGNHAYLKTVDGLYVRSKFVRLAEKQTRPEELKPWERWIDVDLQRQLLVAYEGDRPVYATLVSTGRKGTEEESFRTPKGKFRIRSKHISSSMAGSTATDGDYAIQDVPWAMFFEGNYALHGAFWHTRFGRVRSHGCVNLGPTDARWLFNFATPFLPEGWHGVSAHAESPGTMVVVH